MKSSRLLMATLVSGAATVACSSSDTQPVATSTVTSTATVAGPVTSTVNTASVTSAAVTTATVTSAGSVTVTAAAVTTGTATSGGASTTGAAATTTGAGGATATAATGATATTGGDSCTGTATATAAVPITPADGWVDCASNAIGIQGAFFTYDDGTSTIMPGDFAAAGAEICVTGTVAATATDVWGAGVGFNLNQDVGSDTANAWDATAAGVSGISFNLSALPAGGLLRLIYASGGVDHCVEITAAGEQTVLFSETTAECWEAGGAAPPATTLESVKWQVAAVTDEYAFDFCISAVAAVP